MITTMTGNSAHPTALDHTIDMLEAIAQGPLAERVTITSERIALLTLFVADRRGETLTMSELARRTRISRAAMTSMADRLQDARLVDRVSDPDDRRSTLLQITEQGVELVNDAIAMVHA